MSDSFNDYLKIINSPKNNNQKKSNTVQYHNSFSNQSKDVNSEVSKKIFLGLNSQAQPNADILVSKRNPVNEMKNSEEFSKKERIKKDLKNENKVCKEEASEAETNLKKFKENSNFKYLYLIIYKSLIQRKKNKKKEENKKVIYRVKKTSVQHQFNNKFNFLLREVDVNNLLYNFRLKL